MTMVRQDLDNGEMEITCGESTQKWLVLRKTLDASKISLQVRNLDFLLTHSNNEIY